MERGEKMEKVLIQVKVDADLKEELTTIYADLGIDIPTAIRIFLVKCRKEKGIPFPLKVTTPQITKAVAQKAFDALWQEAKDLPPMTLEEINAEIAAARQERQSR